MSQKIENYKDLKVWQRSHKAALKFYLASRKRKRRMETSDIWAQSLRSAFSVPANIVEGFYSRKGKKFINFLEIARGSAGESHYWVNTLAEVSEISRELASELSKEYEELTLMLSGMIKKLKKK